MYFHKFLYKPFLLFSLMNSIMMAISSFSWIFIWIMMEINLFMFIPLMMSSFSNKEIEGSIKYFLIQSISSLMMLLLWMMTTSSIMMMYMYINKTLLSFCILMKMGAAPYHLWYPQIMNSMTWLNCFILSSLQKMIPLFLWAYFLSFNSMKLFSFIIFMNSFIGGWMGLNQSQLRPLMAYSSINHLSWMLSSMKISFSMFMIYFFSYLIMILPLFYYFNYLNLYSSAFFNSFLYSSNNMFLCLMLLSLGGLPPFLGFFPKWMIISKLFLKFPFICSILILGSLLSLYYYLMLLFNIFMFSYHNFLMKKWISLYYLPSLLMGPFIIFIYAMIIFNKSSHK